MLILSMNHLRKIKILNVNKTPKKTTEMTDSDDRNGQTCTMCCAGYYTETSIHDDWDGVLHCTNKKCNHEVKRYKWKDNAQPKVDKIGMTNEQKIDALTELLTDVIHSLNMKQYLIEDPTESYKCETEADEYHQKMCDILH